MRANPAVELPIVPAAGILICTANEPKQFLLLKHKNRWDLPKGHAESGETLRQTALRETCEETGLDESQITLSEDFAFVIEYDVCSKRWGDHRKQVTYFLGTIREACEISLTEHVGYEWFDWPPPPIQAETIDPLLRSVQEFWGEP